MSDNPVLFDTNILVYANDVSNPEKQVKARQCIRSTLLEGNGVLTTQVLAEFWVTVTMKLPQPLERTLAREQMRLFSSFLILPVDHATIFSALHLQEQYSLSYWDAQIIASARLAGIETVWSEDMQQDGLYDGVRVLNPLL